MKNLFLFIKVIYWAFIGKRTQNMEYFSQKGKKRGGIQWKKNEHICNCWSQGMDTWRFLILFPFVCVYLQLQRIKNARTHDKSGSYFLMCFPHDLVGHFMCSFKFFYSLFPQKFLNCILVLLLLLILLRFQEQHI